MKGMVQIDGAGRAKRRAVVVALAIAGAFCGFAAQAATGAAGQDNSAALLIGALAAGAALFVVALVLLLPRVLRAKAVAPAPGVAAVGRNELVARLMALNDGSRPWVVRLGPEADVVVEWKYADAQWWGVMAKQGLREVHRLRLYLDEAAHQVGALDESAAVEWAAGALPAPILHYRRSGFQGVQIAKSSRTVAYGFDTPTGGGFGKQLDARFDLDALKQPVIAAVTGAGWRYQPVMRPQ